MNWDRYNYVFSILHAKVEFYSVRTHRTGNVAAAKQMLKK